MEIIFTNLLYFNVYPNTAVNVSDYKILNIKFHLTLIFLLSLTKISQSFCAVNTHSYATYKDRSS
jgi:hypothetical protein